MREGAVSDGVFSDGAFSDASKKSWLGATPMKAIGGSKGERALGVNVSPMALEIVWKFTHMI